MLDAATIKGFVGSCLITRFDEPAPIPEFHSELWALCTTKERKVAIAAPRGFAKSTAITLSYLLATLLFRERRYAIIVSDTEGQAVQFLGDLKSELLDNEDLQALFGKVEMLRDSESKIEVRFEDGHEFRVEAKGSEQKVRGLKWRSKRPDLIVCDDIENDEIVMNKERREKFRNWFNKALLPCLSDKGKVVLVGTVLHMDSVLERLLNDPHWSTARYAAHDDDFSNLLWPEKRTKEWLEEERNRYVSQGCPEGYSQEYLNKPIDESTAYFKRTDFRYYDPKEINLDRLSYYSAADFAISSKEKSDYTAIVTIGIDERRNIYIVDVRRGRWDGKEIIDEIMAVEARYHPGLFGVENGTISKSLGPFLHEAMIEDDYWPNIRELQPNKDKEYRARSIQARLKQGTLFFDGEADWYADLEQEMVRFPRDVHDDQVDALAWIGLMLKDVHVGATAREWEEECWEEEMGDYEKPVGKNRTCGY